MELISVRIIGHLFAVNDVEMTILESAQNL
jgi:hypothetical protein